MRPRPGTWILAAALAALLVAACDTGPVASEPGGATPTAGVVAASPSPAATEVDPAEAVLRGEWRRVPVPPSGPLVAAADARCRAAEPAIGTTPIAVADARGESRLLFVYAADALGPAWECRTALDAADPVGTTVLRLQAAGDPLAPNGIDARHYEQLGAGEGFVHVLVGRVGDAAVKAIANFPLEVYVYGSIGHGWWAMWWPGIDGTTGVGATDTHNLVIGSVVPALPTLP